MQAKYQSGDIIPHKEEKELPQTKCKHKHIVPLEIRFARIFHTSYSDPPQYDYTANVMGSHVARVTDYWCLDCDKIIKAPKRKD